MSNRKFIFFVPENAQPLWQDFKSSFLLLQQQQQQKLSPPITIEERVYYEKEEEFDGVTKRDNVVLFVDASKPMRLGEFDGEFNPFISVASHKFRDKVSMLLGGRDNNEWNEFRWSVTRGTYLNRLLNAGRLVFLENEQDLLEYMTAKCKREEQSIRSYSRKTKLIVALVAVVIIFSVYMWVPIFPSDAEVTPVLTNDVPTLNTSEAAPTTNPVPTTEATSKTKAPPTFHTPEAPAKAATTEAAPTIHTTEAATTNDVNATTSDAATPTTEAGATTKATPTPEATPTTTAAAKRAAAKKAKAKAKAEAAATTNTESTSRTTPTTDVNARQLQQFSFFLADARRCMSSLVKTVNADPHKQNLTHVLTYLANVSEFPTIDNIVRARNSYVKARDSFVQAYADVYGSSVSKNEKQHVHKTKSKEWIKYTTLREAAGWNSGWLCE